MTIHYFNKFQEARPANFDGLFDWDFLLPIFSGTKIEPMDIDAVIERKGKVLLFETKDPGITVPDGQLITIKQLVNIGRGRIQAFIIHGKTEHEIVDMQEIFFSKKANRVIERNIVECDSNYVITRVTDWWNWANR